MNDILPDSTPLTWDFFASFRRIHGGKPIIAVARPDWAAATHAIVVDEIVHYYWAMRQAPPRWVLMHATAPSHDPTAITQDPRNPIFVPSDRGFDDEAIEYPFPFLNPADGKYYMYYRGKGRGCPEQTGLLVCEGDMGVWRRVSESPLIPAEYDHEADGSTHPSVAIDEETIHIIYTGKATASYEYGLTLCHATAPLSNPALVTKDRANPVFRGSGEDWDSRAIRETEIIKGSEYFHIIYGGYDGSVWRVGHVRTRDFRSFDANPNNPVFSPAEDASAWDGTSVLTAQIFKGGEGYFMLYAGMDGTTWQTGLAKSGS